MPWRLSLEPFIVEGSSAPVAFSNHPFSQSPSSPSDYWNLDWHAV
jgi:hypothetical protein